MKSWIRIGLIIAVALALPLAAISGGDAAKGKALFGSKCAMCHGADGEGKAAMAKALKVEFKPLASKEVQAKKDAELKKDILEGNGKMKPVKLTDEEAASVIAFLRTLKK